MGWEDGREPRWKAKPQLACCDGQTASPTPPAKQKHGGFLESISKRLREIFPPGSSLASPSPRCRSFPSPPRAVKYGCPQVNTLQPRRNDPRAAAPERSRHWNKEVSPASEPASLLHSPEKCICKRQPGRAQTTPCKLLANSHLLALQKLRVSSAVVGFLGSLRTRDARCGTHW